MGLQTDAWFSARLKATAVIVAMATGWWISDLPLPPCLVLLGCGSTLMKLLNQQRELQIIDPNIHLNLTMTTVKITKSIWNKS